MLFNDCSNYTQMTINGE